jgi:hypothetical protein
MLSRREAVAAALGAAAGAIGFARPAAPAAAHPYRRGIGVHELLNWAELDPADRRRYAWPPFVGGSFDFDRRLFAALRSAGFDFVRVTVDPGPFLQATAEQRAAIDAVLVDRVQRLLALDLGVIVNIHPNTQTGADVPSRLLAETGSIASDFATVLGSIASALAPLSRRAVAFEPFNEPDAYGTAGVARWSRLQGRWHDLIRARAPDLTIVLTGGRGGNAAGLMDIDATRYRDSRVLWTFHYYQPHIFTHQGIESEGGSTQLWRYFSKLPYPALPGLEQATWARVRARIEQDTSLDLVRRVETRLYARRELSSYFASGAGPAVIAADFAAVAKWATRNGVEPANILLGEFGVTRGETGAEEADRKAWLFDVRSASERLGFAWSVWTATGAGGMAIVDDDHRIDPATLVALGLAAA